MTYCLLVGGPMGGQHVALPDGSTHLKVLYDPELRGRPDEEVTHKVGFYVRRDAYSLEWQPSPH